MEKVYRTGIGLDVHRLVEGRKCIIGGVEIPHEKGLLGHSDADVLVHAICDALLGAMGLGDIGTFFPDNDPRYRGIDSMLLLAEVRAKMESGGFTLVNLDSVVMGERPKLKPHRGAMQERIAQVLGVPVGRIGIKATTTEKLGFTGREEGLAAQAVVSLYGPLDSAIQG